MHHHQSDSDSSDDSMGHPPSMKSKASSKRSHLCSSSSDELPGILADVNRLRDDFFHLYERDYPQLQRCIEKLHCIIKTFERDFRRATKRTRNGGAAGMLGVAAGLAGLALAPFTFGTSLVVTAAGASAAVGGGIYGGISSSEKKRKMEQITKDIKAELEEFQDKINPMAGKMKDINERIEKILRDLDELQQEASDVSKYFSSISERRNIWREDMTALTEQMSITTLLIGTINAIYSGVSLLLDLLSVIGNTRTLDDMYKLAITPVDKEIDESEIKTKAGKFIVEMRKVILQLKNIMEEIKKTKDKMTVF